MNRDVDFASNNFNASNQLYSSAFLVVVDVNVCLRRRYVAMTGQ